MRTALLVSILNRHLLICSCNQQAPVYTRAHTGHQTKGIRHMKNEELTKAENGHKPGNKHNDSLEHRVSKLGHLLHHYYMASAHARGAAGDPLRGQGRVLALLRENPQVTQRELQDQLDMRQQSLSELLAKLEEKGYVERGRSEQDGRVTTVTLTEAGREATPSPEEAQSHLDAFDTLTAEEQAELGRLVDKASAGVEEKLEALGVKPGDKRDHGCHGPHHGEKRDDHGRGSHKGNHDHHDGRDEHDDHHHGERGHAKGKDHHDNRGDKTGHRQGHEGRGK